MCRLQSGEILAIVNTVTRGHVIDSAIDGDDDLFAFAKRVFSGNDQQMRDVPASPSAVHFECVPSAAPSAPTDEPAPLVRAPELALVPSGNNASAAKTQKARESKALLKLLLDQLLGEFRNKFPCAHIPWSDSKVKAMYGDYARCRWLWLMLQNGKSCLIKYIEGPAGGEVGLMGIVSYTVINKQVFEEDVPVYNDEGMLYIERFSTDCTENRNRVLGMKMVRENIVVFDADARDKVKRKTAETHKKASAKKRAAGLDADRLQAPKKPKTAGADIW